MKLELKESSLFCDAEVLRYTHTSECNNGAEMTFSLVVPRSKEFRTRKMPILYVLSGLTCNDRNFTDKVKTAQAEAIKRGIILAMPDTSPRSGTPGEDDSPLLGTGASYYVNAKKEPYARHYQMFTYVTEEFPRLVESMVLPDIFNGVRSVMGHSMGGHGSIVCFLRKPGFFTSCSAFAPVGNPSAVENAPGAKAFAVYLGPKEESIANWEIYDSCCLIRAHRGSAVEIMVDQGAADKKRGLLQSERLVEAAKENPGVEVQYRLCEGYDHDLSNFVSTFGPEHIQYHAGKMGLTDTDDESQSSLSKASITSVLLGAMGIGFVAGAAFTGLLLAKPRL